MPTPAPPSTGCGPARSRPSAPPGPAPTLDQILRAWGGLFDGTWALVHRFDEQGRRYWVVHRAQTELAALQRLSQPERNALVLRIYGWWPKAIAQRLDVSVSTVHTWLSDARRKLGGVSWRELALMFQDVGQAEAFRHLTDLEPGERP